MSRRVLVGLAVMLSMAVAPASALAVAPSGSFVRVTGTAPIYVVVGGALIHVDSCAPLSGCPNLQQVPTLAGYAAVPADGSFIRIQNGPNSGFIGVVVGGAIIHVDSCAFLPCITVGLDAGGAADYMAAHPAPADGSYVRVADGPGAGLIARAAGGAFLPIYDCAPLGGCPGWVGIDSGGLGDYVKAHPLPADGTVLRALPSGTLWVMLGGERVRTAFSVGQAVEVDDESLGRIPVADPAGTGTATTKPVVERRRHRALEVRMALRWQWNRGRTQLVGITLGHHPRGVKISVHCRGKGCPLHGRVATFRLVPRLRDALESGVYRAGDRLTITLTARGYRRERIMVRIRDGQIPKVRLL